MDLLGHLANHEQRIKLLEASVYSANTAAVLQPLSPLVEAKEAPEPAYVEKYPKVRVYQMLGGMWVYGRSSGGEWWLSGKYKSQAHQSEEHRKEDKDYLLLPPRERDAWLGAHPLPTPAPKQGESVEASGNTVRADASKSYPTYCPCGRVIRTEPVEDHHICLHCNDALCERCCDIRRTEKQMETNQKKLYCEITGNDYEECQEALTSPNLPATTDSSLTARNYTIVTPRMPMAQLSSMESHLKNVIGSKLSSFNRGDSSGYGEAWIELRFETDPETPKPVARDVKDWPGNAMVGDRWKWSGMESVVIGVDNDQIVCEVARPKYKDHSCFSKKSGSWLQYAADIILATTEPKPSPDILKAAEGKERV